MGEIRHHHLGAVELCILENRVQVQNPPTSQYRHSHEASECLYCLLGIDTNLRDAHPSMLTAPWPPGARVPNCTLTSPPSALNDAPNLIKVGLFPFKTYWTHELLQKQTRAAIHGHFCSKLSLELRSYAQKSSDSNRWLKFDSNSVGAAPHLTQHSTKRILSCAAGYTFYFCSSWSCDPSSGQTRSFSIQQISLFLKENLCV